MSNAQIPSTMRGILISKTGGPEVLEYKTDLPVPQPKEGQVLVKNEWIGVNYIDTYFRSGLYPSPKPEILGREASGTIVSLGPSSPSSPFHGLEVGDRVAWLATGSYAEYTAVPSLHVFKIPQGVDSQKAAAGLLQGLTAITLVREAHGTRKGDWALVHAAAGGMGLLLCQILSRLGARVIATASSAEKLDLAKKNGAEFLINYSTQDWVKEVLDLTDGQGVDVVLDGVGKSTFDGDLQAVKRKGTLISYGNASGAVPPLAISKLSPKNIRLLRPQLFGYIATRPEFVTFADELFGWLGQDKLDVRVHGVYDLEDVRRAHEDLEGRKTMGKVLLKV